MNEGLEQLRQKRRKWVVANQENNFEEGIKRLLTDLYPDNAHFIYELLQNAEDTGATEVSFTLDTNKIEFKHNGMRLFSFDDVDGITSIGVSTKRDDFTNIGKFGVGFKAVFAYTNTPEIHSGNYHFNIHDLVVPEPEGIKHPRIGRQETFFSFPFDHPTKKPAQNAVEEITKGLNDLGDNILLFLNHIRKIEYRLPNQLVGSLERVVLGNRRIEIHVSYPDGKKSISYWLQFEKDVDVQDDDGTQKKCRIAIAYSHEQEEHKGRLQWKIVPLDRGQVSIYFPAEKETSNLRFHLHAPFASTVARDSVRDCAGNNQLRDHLAELVVESLAAIRDQKLLTIGFLAVMPNPKDNLPEFYEPIRKAVVAAFQDENLTPTKNKTHAAASILYRGPARISEALDDDGLSLLTEDEFSLWAANPSQLNQREDHFLESLEIKDWGWSELIGAIMRVWVWSFSGKKERVEHWIKQKNDAWLMRFYALLSEAFLESHNSNYYDYFKRNPSPIVRVGTDKGYEHVTPNEAFFPPEEGTPPPPDIHFVKKEVYNAGRSPVQKKYATLFLENIGVRPFDEKAVIELRLDRYCPPPEQNEGHYEDLIRFIAYWKKNPNEVSLFCNHIFLLGVSDDGNLEWRKPADLCLDVPYLETGLAKLSNIHGKYAIWDGYPEKLDQSQVKNFTDFLKAIGVMHELKVEPADIKENPDSKRLMAPQYYGEGKRRKTNTGIEEDYSIPNLKEYLDTQSINASRLVWDAMIRADEESAVARFRPNVWCENMEAEAQLVYYLKRFAWIPDKSEDFHKPEDITKDDLRKDFPYDDRNGLMTAIGFSENAGIRNEEYQIQNRLAQKIGFDSAKQAKEWAKVIKEIGMTPAELRSRLFPNPEKEKPKFPTRDSSNPERRQEQRAEHLKNAPEKEYEQQKRSVRPTRGTIDPDRWLRDWYTNDDDQLICQICKQEMPFKKRDGEYYFEAVEALSEEDFPKEYEAQFLALCPVCAARYKEWVKQDKDAMDTFKNALLDSDEPEVSLQLGDLSTTIQFVDIHFKDMKTSLKLRTIDSDK